MGMTFFLRGKISHVFVMQLQTTHVSSMPNIKKNPVAFLCHLGARSEEVRSQLKASLFVCSFVFVMFDTRTENLSRRFWPGILEPKSKAM